MNTDPIIDKAKTDLADIVKQMDALGAKRKKLEAFLSIYEEPAEQGGVLGTKYVKVEFAGRKGIHEHQITQKAIITNAVYQILSASAPQHTRGLLKELSAEGIEIGAADKVVGLSNLLSRDDRFQANRALGWSLKK